VPQHAALAVDQHADRLADGQSRLLELVETQHSPLGKGGGAGLFGAGELATGVEDTSDDDFVAPDLECDADPAFKTDDSKTGLDFIPHRTMLGEMTQTA
jgi:hypothetical protein